MAEFDFTVFGVWSAITAVVIGMTNMPEAKLSREAEIRYTTVAMVTDFVIDGFVFGHSTVGGDDATDVILSMYDNT